MSTTIVHVRVDEKTKQRATKALAAMGMSVSDAVRMLLVRVAAAEKALPFDVKVPNATTAKAIRAADTGKGKRQRVSQFRRDAKLTLLIEGSALPPRYKDHPLGGEWMHFRDCHIEPDWILIYKIDGEDLTVPTGTHSDLF